MNGKPNEVETPEWHEDRELILISDGLRDRISKEEVVDYFAGAGKHEKALNRWWCRIALVNGKEFDCPVESYSCVDERHRVMLRVTPATAMYVVSEPKTKILIMFDDEIAIECDVKKIHSTECERETVVLEFS